MGEGGGEEGVEGDGVEVGGLMGEVTGKNGDLGNGMVGGVAVGVPDDGGREGWVERNRGEFMADTRPNVLLKVRELWLAFLCGPECQKLIQELEQNVGGENGAARFVAGLAQVDSGRSVADLKADIHDLIQQLSMFPSGTHEHTGRKDAHAVKPGSNGNLRHTPESLAHANGHDKLRALESLDSSPVIDIGPPQGPDALSVPSLGRMGALKTGEAHERELIEEFFRQGNTASNDFRDLVVEVVGLPSFFAGVLFDKIVGDEGVESAQEVLLTAEMFWGYYEKECAGRTPDEKLFYALLDGAERDHLVPSDFDGLLGGLVATHPGLKFLDSTPEFQVRYSQTVVQRIFYSCSGTQCNSKLSLNQLKRGKLLKTLMLLDEEEDINCERRFFSYEHFYVLYCGFWELDTDHDLLISFDDLLRYRGFSLTYRIVARIFGGHGRPLESCVDGYMSYNDYVWFALSEEDKRTPTAFDYWFRCVDLDGDGRISLYDIEYFYGEQMRRMECLGYEVVPLRDIICQGRDMIGSDDSAELSITRMDLKRSQLGPELFNILFNINKFFAQESREAIRLRRGVNADWTDWDRFAAAEYQRLTAEEDEEMQQDEDWEELRVE